MLTSKDNGEEYDEDMPIDNMIISQAKEKLDRLLNDLQTIFTVLSEIKVNKETKGTIESSFKELESISAQAEHINSVVSKLLNSLKKQSGKVKAA